MRGLSADYYTTSAQHHRAGAHHMVPLFLSGRQVCTPLRLGLFFYPAVRSPRLLNAEALHQPGVTASSGSR
jgi:hypothetical protein